jgi:HlyD family secretion protein
MPTRLLPRGRLWIAAALTLALAGAAALAVRRLPAAPAPPPASSDGGRRVACLGHIEPEDGVVVLAARSLMGQPSIVAELRVKEGDSVSAGQIVAVLNSHDQLEAGWREAEARVVLAARQLAQVEAGARTGDLAAQEAEVARLQAELANVEAEHRRFAALFEQHVIAQAELDTSRTKLTAARQMVEQAKNRLNGLAEIRKTDLEAARAAVDAAQAAARRARAEYEPSIVKSPIAGRVIKIHAWPGEEIGPDGIAELGKTDRMYVIAEVPENDVRWLKAGDPARVTGDALPSPIDGVVEEIGYKVGQTRVVPADPAAYVDARVVQVKIRLRDAARAERLIHARVSVVTNPATP